MVLRTIVAGAAGLLLAIPCVASDFVIDGLIVVPIDRIEVPARATGVIAALDVHEGESVKKDQSLAHLDDSQASLESTRALMQLRISQTLGMSPVELDLARKTLERTEQTAREQEIARAISHRKAANDIRVRAAEKAEAVAGNELKRAADARKAFVDSVSRSEIDGLTLALQRSQLETKQAAFEREMDAMLAQSEDASAVEQKLAIEQSRLGVEQSLSDQGIAKLKAQAAFHDSQLAALVVKHHHLEAPIEGVVVKIFRRPGQWVQIGEPVVELVRLDRLRAEGFVAYEVAAKLRSLPNVEIALPSEATRTGKVAFVMPEVDPVNGQVKFWIEFDNPMQEVLPGMPLSITVLP